MTKATITKTTTTKATTTKVNRMTKFTASYDKKHNVNKDNFNEKCKNAYLTKFRINSKNKQVLLLDGKHMRSTSACTSIGIEKRNITSVERDRLLHNYHLKNGINSIYGDAWKTVSTYNRYNPYQFVIFDTVSSIHTVSKNVENIFRNNFLAKKSVLALTVTKRSHINGSNCYADYDALKKLIDVIMLKYKFNGAIYAEQEQSKVISVIYTFE